MRRNGFFFFFVTVVISLVLLVSCNNSMESGNLTVSISNGAASRGLISVSMDVAEYSISILDSNGNQIAAKTVGAGQADVVSFTLPLGSYSVIAEAKNGDRITIGRGQTSVSILAGKTTSCTIEVNEIAGTGTLSFSVECSDSSMSAKIYDAGLNLIDTVELEKNGTIHSGSASLENGYYYFQIAFSNGAVAEVETVRIIAGQEIVFSGRYTADGKGGFVIINKIVGTPTIEITTDKTNYLVSDTQITAGAQISNLTGTMFKWFIDEEEVSTSDSSADAVIDISGLDTGTHTLMLLVSDGSRIWSESKSFSISSSSFDGYYVGSRDYEGYWYFFEIDGDQITYSYYEGSLVEYETVPYRVVEDENGTFLVFKVDRRDYDYALYLPSDSSAYANLYYEYGVDENGESVDRYVRINLEKRQNAVTWTHVGYEPNSERYHVGLLQSEYVTVTDRNWEEHTLDENGVCTLCGYDEHYFEIMDNASNVSDGAGRIYPSRYWPGEFTLSDGTVVTEGNKFYVQRWSGYSNYYVLYYPASIYDAYEAGGGNADIDNAFDWYMDEYHPEFDYGNSLYRIADTRSFFENLFELEWIEPSADDVDYGSSRRVVYSDVSLIDPEVERYSFSSYNQNTIKLEDDTPITEQNGIYFANNGKYVTIYYPMIINDMYEKAKGCNADSGNPFWTYLRTYFPDLNTDYDNYEEMVSVLVNGYVEPQLDDFILNVHPY